MKSVDITTLANYESIPLGTHKLTVTAQADGYTDSDPSAEVTFINGYALTVQNNNCTYSPHSSMIAVFEDTVLTFVATTGYNLPDTVTVTNASHTWDKSTGKLTITSVTGNVAVTVTATQPQLATPTNVSATGTVLSWDAVENAERYDIYAGDTLIGNTDGDGYIITTTITNGTYSGDSRVLPGGTATVTITANDGYTLPDAVTVTGATGAWNKTTGTLSISNPTGNVTVAAECVAVVTKHTLTSKTISQYNISVNGTALSAIPYMLSNGDKIVVRVPGMEDSAISLNGVTRSNNENVTVKDADIVVELVDGSYNDPTLTINYTT